jgi:hypothetical protein
MIRCCVIPAEAGIQPFLRRRLKPWTPAFAGVTILSLLLFGCGGENQFYQGPSGSIMPAHVQKIAIRPITRRIETSGHNIVGWEDQLRLRIQEELIRDGRFNYVNDESQADGILSGEITRLMFEPLSYDANNVVQEIKLWVVMDIRFHDRVQDKDLWEEPNLEQEFSYFVSTQPGGMTDEQARDELWDRYARDIIKRLVEGFGSVTGSSERKISGTPPPPPVKAEPDADAQKKKEPRRQAPPSPY